MIEVLNHIDTTIFRWINVGLSNGLFDFLMPILREKFTWLPVYIFLMAFLLINLKSKAWWLILCLIATVGVADSLSSKLIKPSVKRDRPCNVVGMSDWVVERVPCGSGKSFTSSHATNHFAVASFLIFTLFSRRKKWKWILTAWAASIAFAQVYVGVHYPGDILVGAILGSLIGYSLAHYCTRKYVQWYDSQDYLI